MRDNKGENGSMRIVSDRYEIKKSLGRGGFSEVFLAYDRKMHRDVALKQLFGTVDGSDAMRIRDRELRIHSKLQSKHVVALYDTVQYEHHLYLVVELMDHSLAVYEEPVELSRVLRWVGESLMGLSDIHAHGVIHRDVKPGNILVDFNGGIRISDFGVARIEGSESLIAWSPQYTAPELIHGDQENVGPSSDLYSLGYVTYRLLLGSDKMKEAFPEVYGGADREETVKSRWMLWHVNPDRSAPGLHALRSEIPEGISNWVSRLVDKDPAKRFQSAGEALENLQSISGEKISKAEVTRTPTSPALPGEPVSPGRPWGWKVIYAAGALIVVIILFLIFGRDRADHATLVLTPRDADSIFVRWNDEQLKPEGNGLRYKLAEPFDPGHLMIYRDSYLLADSQIVTAAGEKISYDISGHLARWRHVQDSLAMLESLATVIFKVEPASKISVEGIGEKSGREVQFELMPGRYDYVVSSSGYKTKRGSFSIEAGESKDISLTLSRVSKPKKQVITFEKTYGKSEGDSPNDVGNDVQQTGDGGYIVTGWTGGSYGKIVYLIKTDSYGNTQWEKTYNGYGWGSGYAVQQTGDGGFIVAGETGSIDSDGRYVYLIKMDSYGNTQWEKTYGDCAGRAVQHTDDGGFIIAGITRSMGAGGDDVCLIKTDSYGNIQWEKTYGGSYDDAGLGIQQTSDGGFIVTGVISSSDNYTGDVYLIRTDSYGNTQWEKNYGGSNYDFGNAVQQTGDGGYIVAGSTYSMGGGWSDVYLIKTNSYGKTQWERNYGGSDVDKGEAVQQTSDGGFIVAGCTGSRGAGEADVYLIKVDSNGNVHWQKTFGNASDDTGYAVKQTSDGGYVMVGYTESMGPSGIDVYLIKVDSSGNIHK